MTLNTQKKISEAADTYATDIVNKILEDSGAVAALSSAMGGRLVDLGVVTATSLLAGKQLLYTPAAGELVMAVIIDQDTVVLIDGVASVWVATSTAALNATSMRALVCGLGASKWEDSFAVATHFSIPLSSTALPIYAGLDSGAPGFVQGAWQANHASVKGDGVIGAGHVWGAWAAGGTSGGSAPDFAGNIGGSVVDGTITWSDDGAVPTTGSAHMYALVMKVA